MAQFLVILIELWRQRYRVFIPAILFPLLALAYSIGNTQVFEATTILNLNTSEAKSPILRNTTMPENIEMLKRVAKSNQLIKDTLIEIGEILPRTSANKIKKKIKDFSNRISLNMINNNIKINYQSTSAEDIEQTLETFSLNFIDEVLAPERFRVEQNLASLAEQVKYYSEQEYLAIENLVLLKVKNKPIIEENEERKLLRVKRLVSLEFNIQRLQAQLNLAKSEYNKTLAKSKIFFNNVNSRNPNSLLWFIEQPTKITAEKTTDQHIEYMLRSLVLAILLSTILIIAHHVNNSSLRRDDDIYDYFGLKILGRIPNMGDVSLKDGQLQSNIKF